MLTDRYSHLNLPPQQPENTCNMHIGPIQCAESPRAIHFAVAPLVVAQEQETLRFSKFPNLKSQIFIFEYPRTAVWNDLGCTSWTYLMLWILSCCLVNRRSTGCGCAIKIVYNCWDLEIPYLYRYCSNLYDFDPVEIGVIRPMMDQKHDAEMLSFTHSATLFLMVVCSRMDYI